MTGDDDTEREDPLISIYESMSYEDRKVFMREWDKRLQGGDNEW